MRLFFINDIRSVHAQRWALEMVHRGHEVVFLSVRTGELEGVKVLYSDPGDLPAPKWLKLIRHLRFLFKEWWSIRWGGFDIVHVHYLRADATGWVASFHPRSVISVWGSDVRLVEEGGDPRRIGLRRRALEKVKLVTATNRFLEHRVRQLAPKVSRVEIIPFGVDLSHFDRSQWVPSSSDEVRFLSIKPRLIPTYGPDIAIRAMAKVVPEFPTARLTLVGSGESSYVEELKDLTRELGISDHITFTEPVPFVEVPSLFAHTDVLVQSSRWESFGVVILEAAAMGVPAIATDVGGVSDLLTNGDTGLIIPSENVDALAFAMLNLARDKDLRHRIGENAYHLVQSQYDFQKNADRMESLYHELINVGV
jgi:glycosyltransferase involved in cell wall biosynthesis